MPVHPKNEEDLWQLCRDAWKLITATKCKQLVDMVVDRMKKLIKTEAGRLLKLCLELSVSVF